MIVDTESAAHFSLGSEDTRTMTSAKQPMEDEPPSYEQIVHVDSTMSAAHRPHISGSDRSVPLPPPTPPRKVYSYMNPKTGEQIVSYLPPYHPEMVCVQKGEHVEQTKYGCAGLTLAFLFFPLGIGFCMLDRKIKCKRCGRLLDAGN
ncbi:hypothetical protein CERSUDRAFT_83127 [Gelatoporia subvermispora B]|uniref:Uncharacterized protein n=1 Tax=Ceriporiopsis subvermispora (strain B) TaxID=914234 RepID=M2PLT7_CERS8|nr:hypothetical protein CERSUDRAFT_83127 [Gelatoporia subvermispora B]